MYALSIQQPWTWLIANGHKDIENRDWTTNYRGLILLHAGKKLDVNAFDGNALFMPYWYQNCNKPETVYAMPKNKEDYKTGGIVGIAELVDVVTESTSPWFHGHYGFVLRNANPLPFVSLRGKLGLFVMPDELIRQCVSWSL